MTRTNARELAIQLSFAAAATGERPSEILDRFFDEASLAEQDAQEEIWPEEAWDQPQPPAEEYRGQQFQDLLEHLKLGVHMGIFVGVAHASSESGDFHTIEFVNPVFDADTAQRGMFIIFGIVVAVYIQYRGMGKSGNERQVIRV